MYVGFLTADLVHHHGWGQHNLSLIQALRRAEVSVRVVAARNSPPIEGIDVTPILPTLVPAERGVVPKTALQVAHVRRLLNDCDVIHAAVEPFAPLGAWVAGERPLFISGHGSYVRIDQQRWPVRLLYRRVFSRGLVVCVSRYTARVVSSILPDARTAVVNNGVDAEQFIGLHAPADAIEKRGPTILSVGAVKRRKGTLELVQAIAAVRQQMPDVQCVILGSLDASYAERVQAAIAELGLGDCVHLLGRVSDETLLGWYSAADVFVLPSINDGWKFEGYGLVHLEASAAGLPVIGTTDCGAEDAIDDGVTGLLVPQAGIGEALPGAILSILSDPNRARQMGEAGRAKAKRQTWDHVAQQMIALYESELRRDVQLNVSTQGSP
jgi:glycosyltransferase involved in cell wall biosynthesis